MYSRIFNKVQILYQCIYFLCVYVCVCSVSVLQFVPLVYTADCSEIKKIIIIVHSHCFNTLYCFNNALLVTGRKLIQSVKSASDNSQKSTFGSLASNPE